MRPPRTQAVLPVPIQETVSDFVAALVGLGAAASKVAPSNIDNSGNHVVGVYHDDLGKVAALITADIAFAAASGAALALIPATAVKDVLATGTITETLLENFREVANVTATLLNTPTTPHVTLVDVWLTDHDGLPTEVWDLIATPTKRREFAVTIDGYGDGRLGIIIA